MIFFDFSVKMLNNDGCGKPMRITKLNNRVEPMDNHPSRCYRYSRIDIKSKINKGAKLRRYLLCAFVFSLPLNTYGILKMTSVISKKLSNPPISVNSTNTSTQINPKNSYYPTSIPWISDPASCKQSGRVWENEKCWDGEHSALF